LKRDDHVSRLLLEVIVQTVADAREAEKGGADRLEVVRAISLGGLSPSIDLVRLIKDETSLPLRLMLRENSGYQTDPNELTALRKLAEAFATLHVNGFVIGFTASNGDPGLKDVTTVLGGAPDVPATFHRAFDALTNPLHAIDAIAAVPQLDRLLTGGGDGSVERRCARLNTYAERAGPRLRIIAGGGITTEMLYLIALSGCVTEIHVGRGARDGQNPEAPVSSSQVRLLRDTLDRAQQL
jgi:copper homeostasis protein